MTIHRIEAIRSLYKGSYDKATEDKIVWKDGHETTDEENSQIDAEVTSLQAEYDATQYQRDRQTEYPSINDLIVALWENVVEERASAVVSLEAKRQAVKTKYPKP